MRLPDRLRAPAPLLATAAASLLAVAAAYQFSLPVTVGMGAGLPASRLVRDAHGPEGGYRWTRERTRVLLPGPGPRRSVRVEATVSAWRPRGTPHPVIMLAVGDAVTMVRTTPRPQTIVLETVSTGGWTSDLELSVASPTIQPGRTDPRRLGVRLHRVRISTASPFSPGLPPVRPLLMAMALAAAVFGIARRTGASAASAKRAGLITAVLLALAHVAFRAHAVVMLPLLLALAAVLLLIAGMLPAALRVAAAVGQAAALRLAAGVRLLVPGPAAIVAATAIAGTAVAYAARPVVELDLGTGREEPYARGLLAYDADGGVDFRHAGPDAALDLRDLGGATTWRVEVRAASAAPVTVVAEPGAMQAAFGPGWGTSVVSGPAAWGWRSGLRIGFADAEASALRIDRVHIARGRALPPVRIALAVAASALLAALVFAVTGCGRRAATIAGLALAAAAAAALAVDPVLAVPFATVFLAVAAAAAALAAVAAAMNERTALPAAAVAACVVGFAAWMAAPLTPLYRGGHFVFHSSIAEEIWQGRLLHYVLPYPGSMLSQQAQWGNVVVPHPCLFHVVAAPLAALPRPWFYTAVKAALALWLSAMVAAAALLARRLGGERAAVYAAVAMAAMPAAVQLIGLGHLMTIFGCWAMAMAVTLVALRFDRLPERRTWWAAAGLLTVCYLSYTAALLFTALLVAGALPWLLRANRPAALALVRASLAAAAAAFFIYYVHWAGPFLAESVPRLFAGASDGAATVSDTALLARAQAQPRKLAYTFGTAMLPLAGLVGLALASGTGGAAAAVLLAWGLVLVLFSGLDLSFNFLLKHHYFTMVPVAVGLGVLLSRVARTPVGRWAAVAVLCGMAAMAGKIALAVATGRIP